jgi:processive rubber oxygenase RoxA-like protein
MQRNTAQPTFIAVSAIAALILLLASTGAVAQSQVNPGYSHLLNKSYSTTLMPEDMFWSIWKVWPEPLRSEAEKATPAARRQMIFSRYGFVGEEGRNLPLALVSDGKGGVGETCLSCHAGKVAGNYIPGLGNSLWAAALFASDAFKMIQAQGPSTPAVNWPAGFPQPSEIEVIGVNNAFGASEILMAMRDKDLNVQNTPQYPLPPPLLLPTRTPPWWLVKRKKFLYYDDFAARSVREGLMQFTLNPSNSAATIKTYLPDFQEVYAWLMTLEAPKYPWPIDKPLAARGKVVFTNNCARCHGTYGLGGSYPEKTVELSDIGTDSVRLKEFLRDFRKSLVDSWLGEYGKLETRLDPKGYMAPPLDGVWASGPYLHNGSVPTLWDLLNPDKRPKVWRRTEDGYDKVKVGVETAGFDQLPPNVTAEERRYYYQTTQPGFSNSGHNYPNRPLSESDQKALLEYLKTL